MIAKRVAAITGGKFQIRVFGAGEIVPAFGTVDAVQQGTVECTHTAGYYFVGKNKTFAFDTTVPFGMNQRQQNAWIYWGGGLKLMREFFRDFNIISFPAGNTGTQMGGWFRKEVKGLADLKGLKMRIAGLGGVPPREQKQYPYPQRSVFRRPLYPVALVYACTMARRGTFKRSQPARTPRPLSPETQRRAARLLPARVQR